MNIDQIKNEEVRIFPYYKGKYLGVSPLGYSNVKSARKFMNPIPNSDVYAEFGGIEKYEFEHRYFYGLNKERMYVFIDDLYHRRIHQDVVAIDYDSKTYVKDIPNYEEILEDFKKLDYHGTYNISKGDSVLAFEKKWNLFPFCEIDYKDFDKMKSKKTSKEVDFRKGIIHINVEFV